MRPDLADVGMSCARCAERPYLKECWGCGFPPTRDEYGWRRTMWREDESNPGQLISPAERARRGLPAFPELDYGPVVANYEWCPVWFAAFSEAKVGSELTFQYISRAWRLKEDGLLQAVIPPPYTPAFLDLLDLFGTLMAEKRRRDAKLVRVSGGAE